jgi:hypothetical protein
MPKYGKFVPIHAFLEMRTSVTYASLFDPNKGYLNSFCGLHSSPVMYQSLIWRRKQVQFPKRCAFYLEFRMMDKFHKQWCSFPVGEAA